jgi:hypothetical protein
VSFRDRLLATLRAARPILGAPGVLVIGSEVPNLLQPGAALRHAVRSNLTILSLLGPRDGMPDPRTRRAEVLTLLRRLETGDPDLA